MSLGQIFAQSRGQMCRAGLLLFHVGFHLDEEIPDLLCHWEWQKAPFLGLGGRTRVELGVVRGRQGGQQ